MSGLGPYVAGAATTFLAQCGVQFVVVPRVERRKRRESRWEQTLDELGVLLANDLTKAASKARTTVTNAVAVAQGHGDDPRSEVMDFIKQWVAEARIDQGAYVDLAHGRLELLLDRVIAFAPDAPALAEFRVNAYRYRFRVQAVQVLTLDLYDLDLEQLEKDWRAESELRSALIKETAKLAEARSRPRIGMLRAAKLAVRRSRPAATLGRWRAGRQVAAETS